MPDKTPKKVRRETALRRFDTICEELLHLRRDKLRRGLTPEEADREHQLAAEKEDLRRRWPKVAFGRDHAPPLPPPVREKLPPQWKPRPSDRGDRHRQVWHPSDPLHPLPMPDRVKTPPVKKHYGFEVDPPSHTKPRHGREIYATHGVTILIGGLPEHSRHKH